MKKPTNDIAMNNKITSKILILLFVIAIAYLFVQYREEENYLKKNGTVLKASVTGYTLSKSSLLIKYSFIYKQKSYYDMKSAKQLQSRDVSKFLTGKSFPLILSKEDLENNALLIFREDFERYNLVYPDSLKWVCDSLKLKDCN